MGKNTLKLFAIICLLQFTSCKKDSPVSSSPPNALLSFSVSNQVYNAIINNADKNIKAIIPYQLDKRTLTFNFSLSDQAKLLFNNNPLVSGNNIIDCTSNVQLNTSSADQLSNTSWTVNVQTDIAYKGLGNVLTAEKSLTRSNDFYINQIDGSTYQYINCGPSVSTMAIKWADDTFAKTSVQARQSIRTEGGWWTTDDIDNYLTANSISHTFIKLNDFDQNIKKSIDENHVVVLCLDMYYVSYNDDTQQHIDKFYKTPTAKWGHFVLVKGYKIVDQKLYLEVYDPYSGIDKYNIDGTEKGRNRYYSSKDLKTATDLWWPYAIVVAAKGKAVSAAAAKSEVKQSTTIPVAMGR